MSEKELRQEEFRNQIESELQSLEPKTEESESKSEERQFTELELEQMERGWDPNHPDGVSAKEFKRVGEIIEAKRKASKEAQVKSKEVEELTKTVKQLIEDQRITKQKAREEAIKELNMKRLEKMREGDVDAVMAIEQKQAALYNEPQTQTPQPQEIKETPAIIEWKEKNKSWLFKDSDNPEEQAEIEDMRAIVRARAQYYMTDGKHIDDVTGLKDIDSRLKRAFPHRFGEPERPKAAKFASSTTSAVKTGDYSASRLSFDQKKEYENICKADSSYTLEEYIKQLELVGRLPK